MAGCRKKKTTQAQSSISSSFICVLQFLNLNIIHHIVTSLVLKCDLDEISCRRAKPQTQDIEHDTCGYGGVSNT